MGPSKFNWVKKNIPKKGDIFTLPCLITSSCRVISHLKCDSDEHKCVCVHTHTSEIMHKHLTHIVKSYRHYQDDSCAGSKLSESRVTRDCPCIFLVCWQ